MVQVNVVGVMNCARAALPHLLDAAQSGPPRNCSDWSTSPPSRAGLVPAGEWRLQRDQARGRSVQRVAAPGGLRRSTSVWRWSSRAPSARAVEFYNRPEIREQIQSRFGSVERLEADDIADAISYVVTRPAPRSGERGLDQAHRTAAVGRLTKRSRVARRVCSMPRGPYRTCSWVNRSCVRPAAVRAGRGCDRPPAARECGGIASRRFRQRARGPANRSPPRTRSTHSAGQRAQIPGTHGDRDEPAFQLRAGHAEGAAVERPANNRDARPGRRAVESRAQLHGATSPRRSASLTARSSSAVGRRAAKSMRVQVGEVTGMPRCVVMSAAVKFDLRCTTMPGRRRKTTAGTETSISETGGSPSGRQPRHG